MPFEEHREAIIAALRCPGAPSTRPQHTSTTLVERPADTGTRAPIMAKFRSGNETNFVTRTPRRHRDAQPVVRRGPRKEIYS